MTDSTHGQFEPFPTDGEERDHDAAATEMGLEPQSIFKIGNDVFEYQYVDLDEAVVAQLSEPSNTQHEKIPMAELWDAYQRDNLRFGEWCCRFVTTDEPAADGK